MNCIVVNEKGRGGRNWYRLEKLVVIGVVGV